MNLVTGIISAPRPRPTLIASIASMWQAGFSGTPTYVFDDDQERAAQAPASIMGAAYRPNRKVLGNLRNWTHALATLLKEHPDADWFMICEDDITWAKAGHSILSSMMASYRISLNFQKCGGFSLYAPVRVTRDLERTTNQSVLAPGWYMLNHGMKTWGAQCLLFSREQARAILTSPVFGMYLNSPRWTKNVDAIVAEVILMDKKEIAYCIPCLVKHDMGEANSSLGYPDERPNLKTRYFAG